MTTNDRQGGTATGPAYGSAYGSTAYRVSDADRERTVDALRGQYEGGRLDLDEFNARLDKAYAATYTHELNALTADLPGAPRPSGTLTPAPRPPEKRTNAWRVVAVVGLALAALVGLAWILGLMHAHPLLTLIAAVAIAVVLIKKPYRRSEKA